ncbi:MAG: twin-arginine translocation signal domain-containing protein, partial [Hyphomicrobiaceae bacterium]|nr:twin-arginine translocation signal domain-containing protein [Hyphomicrobiaceae bacterium]
MAIDAEEPDRRDFLTLAAGTFVAVGGAISLWPFIDQMNIDAGAQSLASIEVDIAPVVVGQAITVMWR